LAYIIGLALGDGNLSNPNDRAVRLRISCDLKYPYLIKKIKNSLKQAFPDNHVNTVSRKQKCLDVSIYSNRLEKLLGWKAKRGSKFVQKVQVPKWIFGSKTFMVRCLCGLIETDGSVYTDRGYKMVFFTSVIPELAQNYYNMVIALGFKPKMYKVYPVSKYNNQPRYNVRLSRNVQEFLNLVKPDKK
jgi:hypothetical protein